MKKHPAYMIGFLTVIGIICASLLSIVNAITYPIILENEFKTLNETMSGLNVKVTQDLTDDLGDKLLENVNNVYEGKYNEEINCYIFEVNTKNSYTEFKVLVVISKDGKILTISPVGTSGFTTHNMDSSFVGNDFGLANSDKDSLDTNFDSIAGATTSSKSVLSAVKLAFEQYEVLGGHK